MKRPPSRRLIAVAVGLWLTLGVVAWNNVFDREIRSAEQAYLDRQVQHRLGLGPAVTIPEVMEPAIREATLAATMWAGVPTVAGLLAVFIAARRTRLRSSSSSPSSSAPPLPPTAPFP